MLGGGRRGVTFQGLECHEVGRRPALFGLVHWSAPLPSLECRPSSVLYFLFGVVAFFGVSKEMES